ncbi:MAG TPA: transcription-repair coupling factor, partial [Legionella sp.]|nr:transcription-repair coupling factor [Legionella sp.]
MSKSILLPQSITMKQTWGQLYGSSLPLVLAEYGQQTLGVTLIITPDNLSANQLLMELQFFLATEANPPELLLFPDWETLPYDQFSPHQDILSERLYTLSRLQHTTHAIIISPASTLMHRICPPAFLNQYGLVLQEGQTLDINAFRERLQEAGYHSVNKVLEHGEYAVRGSIIDLYPMGSDFPYRIDLFDKEVEGLRRFDPETQRTIEKIPQIQILPAHEYPLDETGIALFRRAFRDAFSGNPSQCPIYDAVTDGRAFGGLEYYLPLFFETPGTFFDFLPKTASVCLIESTQDAAEQFWRELSVRYEQRQYDISRPLLAPSTCFLTPIELLTLANGFKQLRVSQDTLSKKGALNFNLGTPPALPIERQMPQPLHHLCQYMQDTAHRYLIVVESAGRREVLLDLLKQTQIHPKIQPSWTAFLNDSSPINIATGPLIQGAELLDAGISMIVESQLFGEQSTPQRSSTQKAVDPDFIIRDLAELKIGAPVVHIQFGVGRYLGLQTIDNNGYLNEFLILSYAGDDKIYVPVTALNVISRYAGADSEHAPLHRLGSDQWQKEKKKAAEKIHDVAIELLEIYAKREAKPGHVYAFDEYEYQRFASGFPFTETPDQLQAIHQITQDMQSPRPMDRLICGDVGFGKTEVA